MHGADDAGQGDPGPSQEQCEPVVSGHTAEQGDEGMPPDGRLPRLAPLWQATVDMLALTQTPPLEWQVTAPGGQGDTRGPEFAFWSDGGLSIETPDDGDVYLRAEHVPALVTFLRRVGALDA